MMEQLIFAPTSTTPLSSSLLPLLPTAAIALSKPPTSPASTTTTAGDGADELIQLPISTPIYWDDGDDGINGEYDDNNDDVDDSDDDHEDSGSRNDSWMSEQMHRLNAYQERSH